MAPPRKPWTRYESLNPQVVPAPNLKHVARGGKGNGRAKANGRGKGRGAKKKWWEDCEGMCTVCAGVEEGSRCHRYRDSPRV